MNTLREQLLARRTTGMVHNLETEERDRLEMLGDPDEYSEEERSEGVTDYEEISAGHDPEGDISPTLRVILDNPDQNVQFAVLRSFQSVCNGQLLGVLSALARMTPDRGRPGQPEGQDYGQGLDPKYAKTVALERRANAIYSRFEQAAAAIVPLAYDPSKGIQTFPEMLERMTQTTKVTNFPEEVSAILEKQGVPMALVQKIRASQAEKQRGDLQALAPTLLAIYRQLPFRDRLGEVVQPDKETDEGVELTINQKMVGEVQKAKYRYLGFMKGTMEEIPTLLQYDALLEAVKRA